MRPNKQANDDHLARFDKKARDHLQINLYAEVLSLWEAQEGGSFVLFPDWIDGTRRKPPTSTDIFSSQMSSCEVSCLFVFFYIICIERHFLCAHYLQDTACSSTSGGVLHDKKEIITI